MRTLAFITVLLAGGLFDPCHAQTALEGPLAVPAAAAAPIPNSAAKGKKRRAVAKPTRESAAPPAVGSEAPRAHADPVADRGPKTADPALSLGMKWNGSNDSAEQTRSQNYNGDAHGTGAEVGLKLHF